MITENTDIAAAVAEESEIFYQSAEFWVSVAFVLVVAFLFIPISRVVRNLINQRITRIRTELQDAETLKTDAQKLYADYERKFANIDKEIADIVASQQEVIAKTKEKKTLELKQMLQRKQDETEARVEQSFEQAKAEMNVLICNNAFKILTKAIKKNLEKTDYNKLIDASITNIGKWILVANMSNSRLLQYNFSDLYVNVNKDFYISDERYVNSLKN